MWADEDTQKGRRHDTVEHVVDDEEYAKEENLLDCTKLDLRYEFDEPGMALRCTMLPSLTFLRFGALNRRWT